MRLRRLSWTVFLFSLLYLLVTETKWKSSHGLQLQTSYNCGLSQETVDYLIGAEVFSVLRLRQLSLHR